ncbi:MAG: serine hydrolase domain-containing protein [Halothermotrichaceae bacterium]
MTQAYRYVEGEYKSGSFEFIPPYPAGSMSSTASDMANFMIAHLGNGIYKDQRILNKDTAEFMHTQYFTHHEQLDGMALGFIEKTINDQQTLFHNGSTFLFSSGLYLLPEYNTGIFLAYSGGSVLLQAEIVQDFMDKIFPVESSFSPVPTEEQIQRAKAYTGEYHTNRKNISSTGRILSLLQPLQVKVDNEGYLAVSTMGKTSRFAEIEPGVYQILSTDKGQNPYGAFNKIVFDNKTYQQTLLMSDGPMTYSKAPWYASSKFTIGAIIFVIVFFLLSLAFWSIRWIIRIVRMQKMERHLLNITAKTAAVIFISLNLVFLLGFLMMNELDPVYGVPLTYVGVVPEWSSILDILPVFMIVTGIIMLTSNILLWFKKYWHIAEKIHFTIFTLSGGLLLWVFKFWNII